MEEILGVFNNRVFKNNGTIRVVYEYDIMSGYCEYEEIRINNRFRQSGLILVGSDMGDIIEYIHKSVNLSGKDLQEVNKLIKDHSLGKVREYLY
jgi:hypothetical protein